MAALGHGKCSQHSSEEGMFSLLLARITGLQGHLVPPRFATQARGGEAVAPGQGWGSPSRLRGRVSDKGTRLELICGPRRHSQTQQQRLWGWGGQGDERVLAAWQDREGRAMPTFAPPAGAVWEHLGYG